MPLSPQAQTSAWFDDQEFEVHDRLLRVCKTHSQIVPDKLTGKYILSTQVFAANGPGCSVEVNSLIAAAGDTVESRLAAHANGYAAVDIAVSEVRSTQNKDNMGKVVGTLGVAYTPIPAEDEGGPNPYHADIFPRPSGSANRQLTDRSVVLIEVDQGLAAKVYAERSK